MFAFMNVFVIFVSVCILTGNTLITSTAAECKNYAQCIEHTINSTFVDCDGDLSCEGSTITSSDPSGYIDCSGDGSCKRTALTSANDIYCGGHESCYYPDYLIANEEIKCGGSYSCYSNNYVSSNPHIQSIRSNVLCEGTGSCLDAIIQSDDNTYCLADNACSRASINSGNNIYCDGNLSCKESKLKALHKIYCSGTQGCNRATVIDADTIYAYGYSTAFQSKIYARNVKAFGYYAIAGATVDSVNRTVTNVDSYGFDSGYGATVICRSGSSCTVKCKTSGCRTLYFICLVGSTCSVVPSGCPMDGANSDDVIIKGADCPKWSVSVSDEDDGRYLEYIASKAAGDGKKRRKKNGIIEPENYNHNDMEPIPEEVVQPESMFVRCSEYKECDSSTYIGDGYVIYCSGTESCSNATLGNLPGNIGSAINCVGQSACVRSKLMGAGDIRCGGKWGCMKAKSIMGYDPSSRIECYGAESCERIQGKLSGNEIECHGALSCKFSKIESTDFVQCDGFESCLRGEILSEDGIIFCGGSSACSNSISLESKTSNVICSGKTGCQDSTIKGSLVHIGGTQSGMWSKIYADSIQAFGYKALEFATVDSIDETVMTIKAYGYMTGHRATIICRSGSQCILKCQSTGCFGMEFICLDGSFCSITPSECKMDNSIDKTKGIDCPIWKTSLSSNDDKILIKHIEDKQEYHNTLFKLQNYDAKYIENDEFASMVMENAIAIPRHYHRAYLYLSIIICVTLMFLIPGCCYLNNRLCQHGKDNDRKDNLFVSVY